MYSYTILVIILGMFTFLFSVHGEFNSIDGIRVCDDTSSSSCDNEDGDEFIISKIKTKKPPKMDLFYSTPLALSMSYLTRWFYGESSLQDLVTEFYHVGSGSAGSVVARRLVEAPQNFRVLLLENGGNPFPLQSIPSLSALMFNNPAMDWGDRIVPQKIACQAFQNESVAFTRGRGSGGSSNMNMMYAMRGNPNDYDRWAKLCGNEEWKFENLLPFFKKMETHNGEFPSEHHGQDGPIHLEKMPFSSLKDEWEAVGKELCYDYRDPNGENQDESFFPYTVNMKEGTRSGPERGYLFPVSKKPNLVIRLYSTATKIELDAKYRAIGVHYETRKENGEKIQKYARATKEIMLSAGTLGSSQLLMLSGIGPKAHLQDMKIPLKVDLPVGQNLQDHVITFVGPFTYNKNKTTDPGLVFDMTEETLHEYFTKRTGPFAANGDYKGGGALIASTHASKKWPDMYFTLVSGPTVPETPEIYKNVFHFKDGLLEKYLAPVMGQDTFYLVLCLGLPQTKGQVTLKSRDPSEGLAIDPNYLSHPQDVDTMLQGIKFALKVALETETMKKIEAKLTPALFPGCEQFGNSHKDNDQYWTCYLKQWTQTMWHFTSTATMGSGAEDKNSVVDSHLRVVGTMGLRVIDNSIQPLVVTTNTNLPAMLIGEKGADFVLREWSNLK